MGDEAAPPFCLLCRRATAAAAPELRAHDINHLGKVTRVSQASQSSFVTVALAEPVRLGREACARKGASLESTVLENLEPAGYLGIDSRSQGETAAQRPRAVVRWSCVAVVP